MPPPLPSFPHRACPREDRGGNPSSPPPVVLADAGTHLSPFPLRFPSLRHSCVEPALVKTRAGIHPRPHPTSRRGVPCGHPPLPIIPAQSQPSEDEGGNPSFVTAPYPSCPHPFRHSRVEPALVKTPAGIHPLPHPTSRRGVPRGRPPATFTPIPSPHMSFRAKRSGVEESRCPRNPHTPSFVVPLSRSCPRENGGRGPIPTASSTDVSSATGKVYSD